MGRLQRCGAGADGGKSPAGACERGGGGSAGQYRLPGLHKEKGYHAPAREQLELSRRRTPLYQLRAEKIPLPNPAAVIKVEKIAGPVLLISSRMDTMWTSELAAEQVTDRLRQHDFPYFYQHLRYDYGGHLFVPVEFWMTKLFKGDRSQKRWNLSRNGADCVPRF